MNILFAALAFASVSSCNQNCAVEGYIYDGLETNLAEVYSLSDSMFSMQDKRTADVNTVTEFSGHFTECSNDSYYCISGPIDLVIPRNSKPSTFTFKGLKCETIVESQRLHGTCHAASGARLKYEFDKKIGVISYSRFEEGAWRPYTLRGDCGLFHS